MASNANRLNEDGRCKATITIGEFCESRNGGSRQPNTLVLVAIGANLSGPGNRAPIETCRQAAARLDSLPGLRLRGLSRWYRSSPVPPSGQPDYVNAVASLVVEPGFAIDPASLLADLMALERACGRQRGSVNAARTLDLDLIGIGDAIRSGIDPILPHPRAHQRLFVLAPLADVAPHWVHPVLGLTAARLLSALSPHAIAQQPIRPV